MPLKSTVYAKKKYRYEEVRDLFVRQLAFNWVETSTAEATRASVRTKIDSFVEGGLEHAPEVLSALLEIVSKDEDITAPVNTRPFVGSFNIRRLLLG